MVLLLRLPTSDLFKGYAAHRCPRDKLNGPLLTGLHLHTHALATQTGYVHYQRRGEKLSLRAGWNEWAGKQGLVVISESRGNTPQSRGFRFSPLCNVTVWARLVKVTLCYTKPVLKIHVELVLCYKCWRILCNQWWCGHRGEGEWYREGKHLSWGN